MNLFSISTSIISILLFSFSLTAQNIKGIVLDDQNHPIPYSTISILKNNVPNGWVTDLSGSFSIDPNMIVSVDSITFSCIGYESLTVSTTTLSTSNENKIQLNHSAFELEEVVIKSSYKEVKKTLGTHKNYSNWGNWCKGADYGYEVAVKVDHKTQTRGILSELKIRVINEGWTSAPPFRIHLYKIDESTGAPAQELLPKPIYPEIDKKHKNWIKVNIEDYKVSYPSNGLFLSVEFLPTKQLNISENPVNVVELFNSKDKKAIKAYLEQKKNLCLLRNRVKDGKESLTWKRKMNQPWLHESGENTANKSWASEAVMGVTVLFYE